MGFKKDFKVNITRLTTAVSQKGFGTILILDNTAEAMPKIYTDIETVASDFDEGSEAYRMASDLFGQGVDEVMMAGTLTEIASELVAELNEITKVNDKFFGLVCTTNASDVITALSEWVNTQEKMYAVTSQDKTISNTSDNTVIAYHPNDNLMEKSFAYMLVREIGSVDLDGKAVPNITSSQIDATEYQVLKDNNINVCLEKFGNLVIDGGDTAGGEKLDIMLSEFWIKARMEEDLAYLKLNTPKVPYMTQGVALLIDVANTRLQIAVDREIIAEDEDGVPEYEITYVPLVDTPVNERADRQYDGVKWKARLAGSIRTGTISGILTV